MQSQALSLAEYHRSQQALQEYYSVGAGEAFEEHYAEDEDEEEQQQEDVQKSVWGGQ